MPPESWTSARCGNSTTSASTRTSPEAQRNPRAPSADGASQAVFARYLNVTTGLVSQWERGEKRPQGATLKLLTLIAKNGLQAGA